MTTLDPHVPVKVIDTEGQSWRQYQATGDQVIKATIFLPVQIRMLVLDHRHRLILLVLASVKTDIWVRCDRPAIVDIHARPETNACTAQIPKSMEYSLDEF